MDEYFQMTYIMNILKSNENQEQLIKSFIYIIVFYFDIDYEQSDGSEDNKNDLVKGKF